MNEFPFKEMRTLQYIRKRKMSDDCGEQKYIKCSKCKCKYINSSFHILKDFGFNRLGEQYKTCTTCMLIKTQDAKQIKQNAPVIALQQNNLPDVLINRIMNFHGGICNGFDMGLYTEHRNKIEPFKKYIKAGNYEVKEIYGKGGRWSNIYLYINISKDNIKDMIEDKISVVSEYPTKYGSMLGRGLISHIDNKFIGINKHTLDIDEFIYLRICIPIKKVIYAQTDD